MLWIVLIARVLIGTTAAEMKRIDAFPGWNGLISRRCCNDDNSLGQNVPIPASKAPSSRLG
jgi:hypothetical protein